MRTLQAKSTYILVLWMLFALMLVIQPARMFMRQSPHLPLMWWAILLAAILIVSVLALRKANGTRDLTWLVVAFALSFSVGLAPTDIDPPIRSTFLALLLVVAAALLIWARRAIRNLPALYQIGMWVLLLFAFYYNVVPVVRSILNM